MLWSVVRRQTGLAHLRERTLRTSSHASTAPATTTSQHLLHQTMAEPILSTESPATWRYVVGFLLVGCAWGLTTPFMRRAAVDQKPAPPRPALTDPQIPWIQRKSLGVYYSISDLLGNPAYAVPLLLNATGSVWFFLLIGQAGIVGYFHSFEYSR